jgi:hypothetical protein
MTVLLLFGVGGCAPSCADEPDEAPPPRGSVGLVPAPPGARGARSATAELEAGVRLDELDPEAEDDDDDREPLGRSDAGALPL